MGQTAVEAIPSATLILVREGVEGMEVLLLQRHAASRGMAGMFVFPGGVLEREDGSPALAERCSGPDDQGCSEPFGQTNGGLAFRVAAVRECFEEAGVLLARDSGGELNLLLPEVGDRFDAHRKALHEGALGFSRFCRLESLALELAQLYNVSHWETPEAATRCFSTRFFAAQMPSRQRVSHDDIEVTAHRWLTPNAALRVSEQGQLPLMFPTIHHLKAMAQHRYCEEWFAELRERQQIETILPRRLSNAAGTRVVLPGEPDYDTLGEGANGG